MALWKLRLTMLGTLAVIIGLSTLAFAIILSFLNAFSFNLLLFFVLGFNLLQWLIAPYMIDAMYGNRELDENEAPRLHRVLSDIASKSGIAKPRLMLANIGIPNAFAYGSPIAGKRIAVTQGLLDSLEDEEVEAVLGHETGHLKHRDVQLMMFVSVLPAIFYYIYYSFMLSAWYGGYGNRRNNGGGAVVVAISALVFYWILNLFVLGFSRLREYYADRHALNVVQDGRRKLSEALAKIVYHSGRFKIGGRGEANAAFKALFISDPDRAVNDAVAIGRPVSDRELVERVMTTRIGWADRLVEILSTHPNIVKRLRALQAS